MGDYIDDLLWREIQSYFPVDNRLTEETLPEEYFLSVMDLEIHIDHYKPTSPCGRINYFMESAEMGGCFLLLPCH